MKPRHQAPLSKYEFLQSLPTKPFLKAQFHIHTNEDLHDGANISYSAEGLILLAREHGYHFLAITNHEKPFEGKKLEFLRTCAQKNGIVLIPGVEKRIHNTDILLYFDYDHEPRAILDTIHTIDDIRKCKEKGLIRLVLIPHPFFHFHSSGNEMRHYLDIIDGIEYSWFYTLPKKWNSISWLNKNFWNMNIPGEEFSREHNLPLIASGDLHTLNWFDKDFTWIRCDHNLESLFQFFMQIRQYHLTFDERNHCVKTNTSPLNQKTFTAESMKIIFNILRYYLIHPWHIFK